MATSPPKTPLAKTLSSFSIDRIASMDSTGVSLAVGAPSNGETLTLTLTVHFTKERRR